MSDIKEILSRAQAEADLLKQQIDETEAAAVKAREEAQDQIDRMRGAYEAEQHAAAQDRAKRKEAEEKLDAAEQSLKMSAEELEATGRRCREVEGIASHLGQALDVINSTLIKQHSTVLQAVELTKQAVDKVAINQGKLAQLQNTTRAVDTKLDTIKASEAAFQEGVVFKLDRIEARLSELEQENSRKGWFSWLLRKT